MVGVDRGSRVGHMGRIVEVVVGRLMGLELEPDKMIIS